MTLASQSLSESVVVNTNDKGLYSFTGLQNGTYTVTPSLNLYQFSPKTLEVKIQDASMLDQDFYGATGITISGTIKLTGTETTFDGFSVNLYRDDETIWSKLFNKNKPRTLVSTATVASNGFFIFMGVSAGKYIVEPSAAGYGFEPASTKIAATVLNVSNLVYTGSLGFTISGKFANLLGVVQPNIIVNLISNSTGATATTTSNSDGTYTFTGLNPGTYSVTPEPSPIYNVVPTTRTVTISLESLRKINFLVFSFCTKPIINLPFWGTNGNVIAILGTNFGPLPSDSTSVVAITLSDGTEISKPAGVYFGTNDPETWVSAVVKTWSPVYITAEVPIMDLRLMRVWVVRGGLTTCIKIVPTNFFINTRI